MIDPPSATHASVPNGRPSLARRLGLFDATMLVMGGIVGAGIFINPYVVAQQVHTPALILGACSSWESHSLTTNTARRRPG